VKLPNAIASRTTQSAAQLLSLFFRLCEMLILTVVLQIGMLPLLARDFHRVTLSGPIANLFAVPLTGVLVSLGFATLLFAIFFHQAALYFVAPLRWLTTLLLYGVDSIAHVPRWSYRIPAPPFWLVALSLVLAVVLAISLRGSSIVAKWTNRVSAALLLVSAVAMATFPFPPRWQHGWLELDVLDVGQGDSLLLISPAGQTILVDAGGAFSDPTHRAEMRGPDPGEDAVSPYLWSRGFKRIDTVALTHAHQDHIGGLTAIFENFQVGALWIGREVASTQQQQLEQLATSHGARIIHELRGGQFDFDGAHGDFLWPQIVPQEIASGAKNDDSLVFRVSFGQRSFLLPGDAEKLAEHAILAEAESGSGVSLHSDVLKIGHHGSKNSTTPDFLAEIQPRLAVISSGEENPYGHPNPLLLDRLREAGVATLRTDTNGAIHILTDGKHLEVSCFVPCPEITAQINSAGPQAPQNQESSKQQ
jgi:competence protein ComEC